MTTDDCQTQVASMPPWCQHEQVYEVDVWQPGTRSWVQLRCCTPCTATLRSGGWKVRSVHSLGDAS